MAAEPTPETTLVFLHFLGGSALSWEPVTAALEGVARFTAIDLPGFGKAVDTPGHSVAEMADAVVARIRAGAPPRWALAGHSMGAKVASVVARRAEDGEDGLAGLSHIVLLAGSPPGCEPMDDDKREQMLGWFKEDAAPSRADAHAYISQNVSRPLTAEAHARAVDDVLRVNPAAWRNWLQGGSREDWAARIGSLRTPALIIAGADDAVLGPHAQRDLTAPHYANARMATIPDTMHLLPLERPDQIARMIAEHIGQAEYAA